MCIRDSFFAYAADFTGGVRVAVGDVDGDARMDIITGAGPGGGPHVRVLRANPTTFQGSFGVTDMDGFFAYGDQFAGGVFVAAPTPLHRMSIDAPLSGSTVPASSDLFGWALYERPIPASPEIGAVHVWAYPVDGSAPRFVGATLIRGDAWSDALIVKRPDVAAVLGGSYTPSGYKVSLSTLPPGTYDVVVFALQWLTGAPVNRRVVRVTIQ